MAKIIKFNGNILNFEQIRKQSVEFLKFQNFCRKLIYNKKTINSQPKRTTIGLLCKFRVLMNSLLELD